VALGHPKEGEKVREKKEKEKKERKEKEKEKGKKKKGRRKEKRRRRRVRRSGGLAGVEVGVPVMVVVAGFRGRKREDEMGEIEGWRWKRRRCRERI